MTTPNGLVVSPSTTVSRAGTCRAPPSSCRLIRAGLARYVEVLGPAPDARVGPVVVRTREEVAGATHPVGLAEATNLDAVQQDAVPARVAVPDLDETAALASLDLDLHAPGAVRQRRRGGDVALHAERPAPVVDGVVVALRARDPSLVLVPALEVERDRLACRKRGRSEKQECGADEDADELSAGEVTMHRVISFRG